MLLNNSFDAFSHCISEIFHENESVLQVSSNEDFLHLRAPMQHVQLTTDFNNSTVLQKYSIYLIILNNVIDLETFLEVIYRTLYYNSKAKTVIIAKEMGDFKKYFKILWNYYLINVLLIDQDLNAFTYYPMSQGNCTGSDPVYLGDCGNVDEYKLDIFKESEIRYFPNCVLKSYIYYIAPYTKPGGIELKMIESVAQELKIKLEVIPNDYPDPGFQRHENGSYKYMLAELYHKKIDAVLGFVGMHQESCVNFDCSFPQYFSHMSFFVPLAKPSEIWRNTFLIFQLPLWIFFLLFFILISTLWMHFRKKEPYISNCVYLFGLIFNSAPNHPTESKLRMLFLAWILSSFLIVNGYLSMMVSFLSKPSYEFQISNIDELLQSGLQFGGFFFLKNFFDGNDTDQNIKLFGKFVVCNVKQICLDKVVKHRNFALVDDTRIIAHMMKSMGYKAFMLPNIITAFPSVYLDKGSPYLDRINEAIVALYGNGFNSKWDSLLTVHHEMISGEANALRLQHLQCSIYAYILGNFIAVICFIWELCTYKY